MFNLTDKDYRIAKHVQAEICCEMEQEHLAEAARAAQHSTTGEAGWPTLMHLPPPMGLEGGFDRPGPAGHSGRSGASFRPGGGACAP